jgi:hypothetical protein
MPAVTLAALFCGTAVLAAAKRAKPTPLATPARAVLATVVVILGVFAFISLKANLDLAAAQTATTAAKYDKAIHDAKAARFWAPWSAAPWQLIGEAQLLAGRRAAARASIEKAIAKDDANWETWLDLAVASGGAERRHAFAVATKLNPLSDQIASWKAIAAKGSA